MKQIAPALLVFTLCVGGAAAQDSDTGATSLMEEGARLFFRGFLQEMEPALEGLQDLADDLRPALSDFVSEMGPALRDLLAEVEDWSVYHPPEMLPNGDIILRRKVPEERVVPEGEIEL